MTRFFLPGVVLCVLLVPAAGHSLEIVTSIKPLQLIVLALTLPGDRVEYIIKPQASPHVHGPTPSARRKMERADLLIWVGAELETRWSPLFGAAASSLKLLESVREQGRISATVDPHIWMSPILVEQAAVRITARLSELNATRAAAYRDELSRFRQDLKRTVAALKMELQPVRQRKFYVMHDAYDYFTDYFNLAMVGYITLSPDVSLSGRHLMAIDADLASGEISCIFSEPQLNPRMVERLIHGHPVRRGVVDPLATGIAENKDGYINFLWAVTMAFSRCLSG